MAQSMSHQQAGPPRGNRLNSFSSVLSQPGQYSSSTPNDDWAYRDSGLAPEREPTKQRVAAEDPSATATPGSGVSEDEDYVLENVKLNIYQTNAGRRRAKVPDKEEEPVVADAQVNETPPQQLNGAPTSEQLSPSTNGRTGEGVDGESKIRHVMLHWEKTWIRGLEKVVLNARMPQGKRKSQIESQNYVLWQHSQSNSLTLKKLENFAAEAKAQGVQESEIVLTYRLLKKVSLESERRFVGGNFLTPRALRYDSLDSSKYSADKCCIFLAFPYFAIMGEQPKKNFVKGAKEHPTRTLLQANYRLNDTTERDKYQCIKILTKKTLRSCIDAEEEEVSKISPKVREELIFVPQLWALIPGLDTLITFGSISDASLRGRDLEVREEIDSGNRKRCSLVRIRFRNQGRVEDLTYPIQQCASWFGLLNKQQQVRTFLKNDREFSDPKKYKLHFHGEAIRANTWASIQKITEAEVLDLWMETPKHKASSETPKQKVPTLSVEIADAAEDLEKKPKEKESRNQETGVLDAKEGLSNAASIKMRQGSRDSVTDGLGSGPYSAVSKENKDQGQEEEEDSGETGTIGASPVKLERLENVPIVYPFFQWRVIDEYGGKNENTQLERMDRFLNLIYRNLPAAVGDTTDGFANVDKTEPRSRTAALAVARKKPSIGGKTAKGVKLELIQVAANRSKEHAEIAQKTFALVVKVFNSFLPKDYEPQGAPMRLFWGALHEIVSRVSACFQAAII